MPTRSRRNWRKSCQPAGHWIALPLQVYRLNTLFMSTKGMERAKISKPPATWAEFNEVAEKMKAAGMTPVANGGNRPDDGQKFEIALAGISPEIYRRALMQLEPDALNSKEVLAAFEQLRKFSNYMNPNIAAQPWAVNLPSFVKGDMGMVMTGGWAQGNLFKAGATVADFSSGPAPQDSGPPCFDLNADCFIFWKSKSADLDAGQKLFAEIVMEPTTQEMYSKITGSIPARTDVNLAGEGFTDGQRNSAAGSEGRDRQGSCGSQPRAQYGAAERHHRGHDRRADRIRSQQRHSRRRRAEEAGRGGRQRAVGRIGRRGRYRCGRQQRTPRPGRLRGESRGFGVAALATR